MFKILLKPLYITLGVLSLIVALIGFLVPIFPGWPFIFIGILLISPTHGKKLIEKIKAKFKKTFQK